MLEYTLRRLALLVPTLVAISIVSFVLIQTPPGDASSIARAQQAVRDERIVSQQQILRPQAGLEQPVYQRYLRWVERLLRGDLGVSREMRRPVGDLVKERLALSLLLSGCTLVVAWAIAFPIGLYSAVRQYSPGDYLTTLLGFMGLAVPEFLLALVVLWITFSVFGGSVGGLFSPPFVEATWSYARVIDLLGHVWLPVVIVGLSHTAGLVRIIRANLLDELHRPSVIAARARGLAEWRVLLRYPVRHALNPFVTTAGWMLPVVLSSEAIVSQVMNLPTLGPLYLASIFDQDVATAASIVMLLAVVTVLGALLSDLLLFWLDPRVRFR